MGTQYIRNVVVLIGERDGDKTMIRNLRISFSVEKTATSEPNRASVTIYNLNADSRSKIEGLSDPVLTVEAGYGVGEEAEIGVIFSGDVDKIESRKDRLDWLTTIETGDGKKDLKDAKLEKSYRKGTKIETIIQDALGSFTNLKNLTLPSGIVDKTKELLSGGTFSGTAKDILNQLLGAQDLEFSVQDGEVLITKKDTPSQEEIFIVNPGTGLINSPSKTKNEGKDKKIRDGLTFTSLLNPKFKPKQKVIVQWESSQETPGEFNQEATITIKKIRHAGDNQTGTFYSSVEGDK